ncbi:hypothetical protein [Haloarcula sp. JP-L23]|uniref:hypothetical protein n=1 Tax=Haloarcula sp. JP-L23 TaxID=2716717 RepID=UPI00140F2049|nr:hypothetical protein G9465_07865 [Haloarcula sp. JP-L23]
MVPPTRRRVLHGAAGLASALAGCGGLLDGTVESTRETPTAGETTYAGSESAPETLGLRADVDRPPVWLSDADGDDGGRPTESEYSSRHTSALVDSPERAERVSVADVPGTDRVGSFLGETDYDSESVYIETHQVEDCFRLELCHVAWNPDEVRTDYALSSRPYDEPCRADEKVYAVRFIRIPAPLDDDEVNGHGSSIGTGSCDSGPMADSEMAAASSDDATATEPSEQSTETTEGSQ